MENKLRGITQIEFEDQRRVLALDILGQAKEFIAWDLEFNKHISDLAAELVKQLKLNPRVVASNMDLSEIIKEMKSGQEGHEFTGGDYFGGGVWDDIWATIKEVLTGEKDFIKEIVLKILNL